MTIKSSRLFSIAITLAALSAAPCLIGQDSQPHAARLTFLEGPVQVDNQDVTSETTLAEGDVLATGDNGVAEVELAGVGMLRLAPDTQVALSQLTGLATGQALTRLDFDGGEMELEILARQPGEVAVSAHNKNIRITTNGRFRFFSANDYPLELAVWAGEATVHDPQSGQDVAVEPGETFTLAANDPEKYDLEKGIEADDLDQFSQMRDQSLATEAENTVPEPTPDSGPDFVDPCQPPYPYVAPPECFNFAAFYAIPIYAYPFATGVGSYHRHPRHLPFLHPLSPPVTAANKPPAGSERVAGPIRRPRIDLNDENFKRTVPESSQTEANNKRVNEAGTEPNTENPNTENPSTKNDARRPVRVMGNSFTESREVRASRPSEFAHPDSAHSAQESSTHSHAGAGTSTQSYSAPHSSGGSSVSVESHSASVASSTASSSSSSSSGHGK